MEEQLVSSVDKIFDQAVKLLADLVNIDSTLEKGEGHIAEFLEDYFKKLNLEVHSLPACLDELKKEEKFAPIDWSYEQKKNVVGIHRAKNKRGKNLIFNGHMDVVPIGPEDKWTSPPFQAVVRDGRLYGRGSGDMKAGIAAFIMAYSAILHLNLQPTADIFFQAVFEEECTGNGALALTVGDSGMKYNDAQLVIIPEPFPFLPIAQLGVMWIKVGIEGKPVHVLDTSAGSNAIESAFKVYSALKALEEKWNDSKVRHPVYQSLKHPINFNLGKVQGGDWASSVPSSCTFEFRVGFFPGVPLDQVRTEIETTIQSACTQLNCKSSVTYIGFQAEGCVMNWEDETRKKAATVFEEAHKQIIKSDLVRSPLTCTTDARYFELYKGIPAIVYGPSANSIHGIDESVCLKSFREVICVFALFIAKWCGLESREK